ncbi:hypothetical protein DFH08DRAFT_808286 [Mycena albidolilacea]|uniref:Uncharacterized protein n=1 Tax=Mycena albidolilacea TaxID=1033008 RepID=A0AAD7A3F0_9AGAR|nr:hypothetical protein DFH08DRAFT_808286 [Mycena albidolilacea]
MALLHLCPFPIVSCCLHLTTALSAHTCCQTFICAALKAVSAAVSPAPRRRARMEQGSEDELGEGDSDDEDWEGGKSNLVVQVEDSEGHVEDEVKALRMKENHRKMCLSILAGAVT